MEGKVEIPRHVGWYHAWGSEPWSRKFMSYYNGETMEYYVFDYVDGLKLMPVALGEHEFIHTFLACDADENEAMWKLEKLKGSS